MIDFINDYPNFDLEAYLTSKHSEDVVSAILSGIQKAKKRKMLVGESVRNISSSFKSPMSSGLKTPSKAGGLNATGGTNRLSTVEKMQEYEEKRANLRQKYGSKRNVYEPESKALDNQEDEAAKDEENSQPDGQNKLGTSIAAMNSSITEKWRNVNSQGGKTSGGLNNTVGG